jgi:hypothetical protein
LKRLIKASRYEGAIIILKAQWVVAKEVFSCISPKNVELSTV